MKLTTEQKQYALQAGVEKLSVEYYSMGGYTGEDKDVKTLLAKKKKELEKQIDIFNEAIADSKVDKPSSTSEAKYEELMDIKMMIEKEYGLFVDFEEPFIEGEDRFGIYLMVFQHDKQSSASMYIYEDSTFSDETPHMDEDYAIHSNSRDGIKNYLEKLGYRENQ